MKPRSAGIHTDISAAAYQADPCPSASLSSGICNDLLQRSALHAWHNHPRLNPAFEAEQNSILDAGTVAHGVLLQGGVDNLVIVEADDWRTKEARGLRDAAWQAGRIPVLAHKMATINAMVQAAKDYVAASELAGIFDGATTESTMIWKEGQAWCRARPDLWTFDRAMILEYKSTATCAEPNAWIRHMLSMGYDVQAAFYRRGALALTGDVPDFVWLVQENVPPYACSLVGMAPSLIEIADRKVEFALTLWQNCIAKNQWNGYPARICHAEAPAYHLRTVEEMLELGSA